MPKPISVTMLSAYEYCQRKLFLEYVLKLFEPPKESMVLGSIRHDTHEAMNKAEQGLVVSIEEKISLEQITKGYKEVYSAILKDMVNKYRYDLEGFKLEQDKVFNKIWPMIEREADRHAKNVFSFMQKTGFLGEELWENLSPKIVSEFSLSSFTLGLKGRIDQLEIYSDSIIPVELKTGKSPNEGAWPGHKLQTTAYLLLLSEKSDGKKVSEGKIIYLDSDKSVIVILNPFSEKEVKDMVSKVNDLLNGRKIPAFCGSDNKCNICGLKKSCYDENLLNERLKSLPKPK